MSKFTGGQGIFLVASSSKSMVTQKEDGIFVSHDKYVAEIVKKFNYTDVKSASTPVDWKTFRFKYTGDADDVDCLWYYRDSPFELVAYTNSDYAGATQDRKSITGGCQFLGNRLISWQYLLSNGFDDGRVSVLGLKYWNA
ncbi:hypothetical protein Tco_1185818 [Tanacetum coccineum]